MDNQPMPNMHDLFWRKNQVIVTFRSEIPLVSTDGTNNAQEILKRLALDSQLQKLNQFLEARRIHYTLGFFNEKDNPQGPPPEPCEEEEDNPQGPSPQPCEEEEDNPQGPSPQLSFEDSRQRTGNFKLPPGVYLYDLVKPIQTDFGKVQTSIVTFFNFAASASSASNAAASPGNDQPSDPVAAIVNEINRGQEVLNGEKVPISAASPVWITGGTPPVPQGCPLTPPLPLDDSSCALWHYQLPHLSPERLQDMAGEGVTIFVLDTLPERRVISDAARKAGDDNLLLLEVKNAITYNYNFLSAGIAGPDPDPAAVGKDVYGEHYPIKIVDHGLFIAGIIHDIAPRAEIECIRVLDEYCVGDLYMFHSALQYIENRLLQGGDLYHLPVVINMSLVTPTKAEAESLHLDPNIGASTEDVMTCVRWPVQSLVGLGAIIAASAGNEGDPRENPMGKRPPALYPAGFAYPPESIEGIIPVGAVDKHGKAASYSCYPGPAGIATYGGEIPVVAPPQPDPSKPLVVTVTDAVRGIYSAGVYPALVAPQPPNPGMPVPVYPAPDDHGWAYWVGTSFATPIISAVAARILEMKAKWANVPNVHRAILTAAGADTTNWDNLDPATTGVSSGSAVGPMLMARQICIVEDEDEDEEVEIEVVSVVDEGKGVVIEAISVDIEERG